MAVWARRPATPKGAILLVHGRTWSSRPDFDLQVPGLQRSVLASFVGAGIRRVRRGSARLRRDAARQHRLAHAASAASPTSSTCSRGSPPSIRRCRSRRWSAGRAARSWPAWRRSRRRRASRTSSCSASRSIRISKFIDVETADTAGEEQNTRRRRPRATSSRRTSRPRAVITAFVEQALKADPILVDVKDDARIQCLRAGETDHAGAGAVRIGRSGLWRSRCR